MIQQLQDWLDQMPVWVPIALAAMAVVVTIYLHRRWQEEGLDPRGAKAVLVPACTVALLGSLARHVPAVASQMPADSLDQLTGFSLLASVIVLIVAAIQARQLQTSAGSSGTSFGATVTYRSPEAADPSPDLQFDQVYEPEFGYSESRNPPMTEFHAPVAPSPASNDATILRRPSARTAQVAWLSALSGPHAGTSWSLTEETSIGRGESDACEIVLSDPTVSGGRHALIRLQDDGSYLLADLASTNGTFVNGEKVSRHQLRDKDRITIGASELVFVRAQLAESAAQPQPEGES